MISSVFALKSKCEIQKFKLYSMSLAFIKFNWAFPLKIIHFFYSFIDKSSYVISMVQS